MTPDDIQVLLAVGGSLAGMAALAYANRREISRLQDAIFGHDRSRQNGGVEGDVDSLADQLDRIEGKVDHNLDDHQHAIQRNHELITDVIDELDIDVDRQRVRFDDDGNRWRDETDDWRGDDD